MPKSPLRLLERRNRAAFDGRSSSERGIERGSSAKTVASWPWVGYAVRARTVKKEILDKSFRYQAQSWSKPRQIVAKAEHHAGELFPRPGFIATNMTLTSRSVVRFYNKRAVGCNVGPLAGREQIRYAMAFYDETFDSSAFSFYVSSDPETAFNVFATGYRRAAEILTDSLLRKPRFSDYEAYPAIFLFRHAFELSLKHAIYKAADYARYTYTSRVDGRLRNDHNLNRLATIVNESLRRLFPTDSFLQQLLPRLTSTARDFDDIDPSSFVYRYPVDAKGGAAADSGQTINLRLFASHMSALLEEIDTVNFGLNNMTDVAQDAFIEWFHNEIDYIP